MGKLCFTFSNFMKKNNNMDTIEYLITASGVIERGMFYNYMHDLGFKDNINLTREYMINSDYPFGVCLKNKEIMVIESATICYLMQKNNKVKTVEEFKKIIKQLKCKIMVTQNSKSSEKVIGIITAWDIIRR